MLDYNLFKELLKPEGERERYIGEDDIVTKKYIELFRKSNQSEVMKLFRKSSGYPHYKVTFKYCCDICGEEELIESSKTKFFEYVYRKTTYYYTLGIKDKNVCSVCYDKIKTEKESIIKLEENKEKIIYEDAVKFYIENYLSTEKYWVHNKMNENFKYIKTRPCYDERVTDHIKEMDYYDFLNTPYWKAVAWKVKKNASFKCQMCGSTEELNAHHPEYSIRGEEVTRIKELICVCKSCHAKHHDK